MTPWEWWAGLLSDIECEGTWQFGGFATRDEAIAAGMAATGPGGVFCLIEAISSTAMRHEHSDTIPFLRTRNYQEIEHPRDHEAELAAERFAIWLALAPILHDMAELNRDNDDSDVTGFEFTLFLQRIRTRLDAIGQGLHRFEFDEDGLQVRP